MEVEYIRRPHSSIAAKDPNYPLSQATVRHRGHLRRDISRESAQALWPNIVRPRDMDAITFGYTYDSDPIYPSRRAPLTVLTSSGTAASFPCRRAPTPSFFWSLPLP